MSDYNIRVAVESDGSNTRVNVRSIYTVKRVRIDWPSVNANVDLVKKNIITSTTFVLENESKLFQQLRFVILGKVNVAFLIIHLSGGLLQNRLMMGKVMVVNF